MVLRSRGTQDHKFGRRVLAFIGRQEWLDRPSYRFEHLLSYAFNSLGNARDGVANFLNGVWLGHPLHPPLASLTSGAIGTAVGLDALSLLPGRPKSELVDASRFARQALGLGILANLAAAVTGVSDWQHTHQEERRVGAVHGVVNLLATGLYVMSWRDRGRGRHLRGIAFSALGYGITLSGSYLGGALVFESGIGIDQSGRRLRTTDWTPVLPVESLTDGKPRRVEVDGVGLVVCRVGVDGKVAAFGELCPHLAAPMSDGWVDRGRIVCPWHGSRFDAETGAVLRGPSAAPLPRYQTRINNGMVEVRAADSHALGAAKGVAK
ncbi:MAG: Rieske 2Fe-2S domain-containing protein [Mycobacterium sp.]|uniref:Rieske 2Fe-2S domain-containing protein n=1 Tax=Mycobacterium sp. TaxID=1785 RepID=UPI002616686E|nr:Rieske 2Fe-2S domain-containing protein [Mycobacterium sp.]MDI3313474.1 Rieske 2Fe-2S domain-containing protein [Mycobacterium sp.]